MDKGRRNDNPRSKLLDYNRDHRADGCEGKLGHENRGKDTDRTGDKHHEQCSDS